MCPTPAHLAPREPRGSWPGCAHRRSAAGSARRTTQPPPTTGSQLSSTNNNSRSRSQCSSVSATGSSVASGTPSSAATNGTTPSPSSRDGETHEPHPVPVRRQCGGGRLQRESCLAAAARSSQSDEPAIPERVEHIGELGSTPDERIDRRGQVVRHRERAQGRKITREQWMRELPDTDSPTSFR